MVNQGKDYRYHGDIRDDLDDADTRQADVTTFVRLPTRLR